MNEDVIGNAVGAMQGYGAPVQLHQPDMKKRLAMAVLEAEQRLASVKRAQEIFEKNPDLEELLNIMQRSHF
jgi:hypothetical protein